MDKKSNKNKIESKSKEFKEYLKTHINSATIDFLEKVSEKTEVLIFSGIIRNYFLNYYGAIRDLDIVLKKIDEDILSIISSYNYRKNSFGGFKLKIDSLEVDLWELTSTWGIKQGKVELKLFEELNLPNTSFFNFSSIIYNYNREEFIYSKHFERFVNTRELDLVLEENPLPQLCLINTIYYKEKFKLSISLKLKIYFVINFNTFTENDFSEIQLKHFGHIMYSYAFLKTYNKIFSKELFDKRILE